MAKKKKKQHKPKVVKNSLLAKKQTGVEPVKKPDYTEEEEVYLSNVQNRLTRARQARDQNHAEFDGLDFISYWHAIERAANTMLTAAKNKADVRFQSGTLRTKMLGLLSTYQGLNLKADISAFNEHEVEVGRLGAGMEDVIEKTEELEGDEEKRMLRQYEMLKLGSVFVEEQWVERWLNDKKLIVPFTGKKSEAKWKPTRVKAKSRPERKTLSALKVYLGSMSQYFIEKQPYIFTAETLDWVDAEQIFGGWDMWEYVGKNLSSMSGDITENQWRLGTELKKEQVEKVIYQDKFSNEFQIFLNGVPMLPIGYPLTAIRADGEYTITQQNLEPIRADFAYGKSFIFKNKNIVAVLDEMMKLAVLKTQKSFMPPYWNISGRLITKDVLMPGKITSMAGLAGKSILAPVSEHETKGVTNSEFGMIHEVISFVDRNTTSQTFGGAKELGGKVTATQIIETQRQARVMMGLLTLAAALLEKKLAIKRLGLLLEKWFEPVDNVVDEARNMLRNRYRAVTRPRDIEGEGRGFRMVVPMDEIPSSQQIMAVEDNLKERLGGTPVRMIILNPKEIREHRFTWVATVNPREKRSSEWSKLMFGQEMAEAQALNLRLNPDYVEQRFAQVWDEDPAKMFLKEAPIPPPAPTGAQATPAGGAQVKVTPSARAPSPADRVLG